MNLQRLHIKNFKSIVDLEIIEPNPFTVFVGPNGSGKSNIFEALELISNIIQSTSSLQKMGMGEKEFQFNSWHIVSLFGGKDSIINKKYNQLLTEFKIETDYQNFKASIDFAKEPQRTDNGILINKFIVRDRINYSLYEMFRDFLRIFPKNEERQKINYRSDLKLNFSTSNLEKVLKRILQDPRKKEEIVDWLQLLIPEFENVEIDVADRLQVKEKSHETLFEKDLLSDGTYNILALLTAVYQSDEWQFLCIEEPENGLNPFVIRKLVDFFRAACADGKHYIWLNTHSQTLVECLNPEEVIVVDKIGGETKIKQFKGMNLHGLDMAEVWLSGALGGGTPW